LVRKILEPESGKSLGFACPRIPRGPSWLRWLARPALEIHESEDESLLFTLYRPWLHLRAWEVIDAEDHLVGGMRKNRVLDRFGRVLAVAASLPEKGSFQLRSADGLELAELLTTERAACLHFALDLAGNPFAKMLLLACALVLTNDQRRGSANRR
jgi:hypothetical protein